MHGNKDDNRFIEDSETWAELFLKYLKGELTAEEKAALDILINQSTQRRKLFEAISDSKQFNNDVKEYFSLTRRFDDVRKTYWAKIINNRQPFIRKPRWRIYMAAASVVILVGTSLYFLLNTQKDEQSKPNIATITPAKPNILPAGNKAILTLSDGRKVALSDSANGTLAQDGKAIIKKKQAGEIVYENIDAMQTEQTVYNSISTPRGGWYKVILPDGSKVWLNAATTLRYPTSFNGKDRNVEVSGEAYFEVKEDKSRPFKAIIIAATSSGETHKEIEVLGTRFNVRAYNDESGFATTLLEGKIKYLSRTESGQSTFAILKPGQCAEVDKKLANKIVVSESENPANSIAWVEGKFAFNRTDLKTVAREFSRWYNVNVIFEDAEAEKLLYTGKIDRTIPLSELLDILEKMGKTRFAVKGNTVIVSQNK